MKKLIIGLALMVGLACGSSQAGIIVSNLTSGTQVVYTGNQKVWQIVAYGATDNIINLFDSQYSSNAYTQPAYTRSTNYTISITNFQTNAVFVYATATQYLMQTNIYVSGNARSNISVSAAVLAIPVSASIPVIAGAISTVPDLDLVFTKGISITATNNATIILYTRD